MSVTRLADGSGTKPAGWSRRVTRTSHGQVASRAANRRTRSADASSIRWASSTTMTVAVAAPGTSNSVTTSSSRVLRNCSSSSLRLRGWPASQVQRDASRAASRQVGRVHRDPVHQSLGDLGRLGIRRTPRTSRSKRGTGSTASTTRTPRTGADDGTSPTSRSRSATRLDLPMPGFTDDLDEPAAAGTKLVQRLLEDPQLRVPADEPYARSAPRRGHRPWRRRRAPAPARPCPSPGTAAARWSGRQSATGPRPRASPASAPARPCHHPRGQVHGVALDRVGTPERGAEVAGEHRRPC